MSTTLKILVPVKRVIDYAVSPPSQSSPILNPHTNPPPSSPQVKPRVNKTRTGVETAGVKHSLNPFDELSLEAALRLRERGPHPVPDILALSAGPAKAADVLRTAMAMGADRSIHVEIDTDKTGDLEPLQVAKVVAAIAAREGRNMVILGKQAIDDDCGQTGQMVAGLLGWGQATSASHVSIVGEEVTVVREVDGGTETLRLRLPVVVTTDLRLNEPRYASLPNIMKAKKKRMEKVSMAELGVDEARRLKTVRVEGVYFVPAVF